VNDLGYLMIDHRACGTGGLAEFKTYTCTHCSTVVIVNPLRTRERGKCYQCNHLLCDNCAAAYWITHECRNLIRLAEESMRQAERQPDGAPPLVLLP
jgi:hypothetical protein